MSGVITSQGYPNHYPSGDCTWSFNGPEGYRGQITFQELALDSRYVCNVIIFSLNTYNSSIH